MDVQKLNVDQDKAQELWRRYQTHRAYQTPADAEIEAIYKRIAKGATVIRALESIRVAGLNAEGLPKLAICRAHVSQCWLHLSTHTATFNSIRNPRSNDTRSMVQVDWPDFIRDHKVAMKLPANQHMPRYEYEARVPLIPVHIRPRRGLANYHILWEAEWTKRYPVDPYLLRRIGGDAWLVVAAWDLTDVERAVMSSRVRA